MRAEDNARVLIELLEEGPSGRNAQNINFCIGRPVALEAPNDHDMCVLNKKLYRDLVNPKASTRVAIVSGAAQGLGRAFRCV